MLFNNALSNTEITGTKPKTTVYCRLASLMKIFVVYFKTRLSMRSSYKYFRLQIRAGNRVNITEFLVVLRGRFCISFDYLKPFADMHFKV